MSSSETGRRPPSVIVEVLRCSVCGSGVELRQQTVRCGQGHSFDLARQGYVNLLAAGVPGDTADSAAMVTARADFLAGGHYATLASLLARAVAEVVTAGVVIDAGTGTGYFLAAVLDQLPQATGLALDASAPALRRATRAHRRIGAAGWNIWHPWPVGTGCADAVLNVFAPRNGAEFHRVLRPDGTLLVVSPQPDHLAELTARFGLVSVDKAKHDRLEAALGDWFCLRDRQSHTERLTLGPVDIRRAIDMGPSAYHIRDTIPSCSTDELIETTASFLISRYRPRTVR